ncbi:MAG: glycosyltransferase [Deltaproteobacteria bacterium]|nr:glycosyltransferase [Deltaproteobacteria bacterium]
MRVLHLNPTFYPSTRDGGPSESLLLLVRGLREAGVDAEIVTTNGDGPKNSAVPLGRRVEHAGVPVTYFERFPRAGFAPSASLVRHVAAVARGFDLVHVHALFSFPSTAGAATCRALAVPYVLSPRGMCEPWALGHRAWKKAPYFRAFERGNLLAARALHATSGSEAANLRALLRGPEVFVVPNAIELPAAALDVERIPGRVVFLGRLHPVKGLDVLVRAMSLVTARRPDAELIVAGPDHHGEGARIACIVATLTPRPRVRVVGEVHGADKACLLASASALALTSKSESFARVVVEALAHGTPAVVSRACPWPELEARGAGRWVEGQPATIANALVDVLDEATRPSARSEAARALAREYDVAAVGATMATRYRELIELNPRPAPR